MAWQKTLVSPCTSHHVLAPEIQISPLSCKFQLRGQVTPGMDAPCLVQSRRTTFNLEDHSIRKNNVPSVVKARSALHHRRNSYFLSGVE